MSDRADFSSTRRTVLIGGVAAGVVATSGTLNPALAASRTRPDIDSPAGKKMVDLYARAVKAMQDPELNYPPQPTSWLFQSYIHGVPSNPFDPANSGGLYTGSDGLKKRIDEIYGNPAAGTPQAKWKQAALACWGTCTHASPYFPTWHRWYMYYFERVCRQMCKDPDFTLPFWNYASNIGASLQLPKQFRPDIPTVLLFDDRGLGFANPQGSGPQNVAMNNGGYMPYPQINYGPALQAKVMFPSDATFAQPPSPQYFAMGFSGRLECVPHDLVHDNVGGWMGNVPSAAGDPIFFMHHCQVDRLYASWEAEPGVSYNWGNDPTQPSEQTWKNRQASFVDEKGNLMTVKLGDAISTEALGYGYDTLAKPPAPSVAAVAAAAAPPATSFAGAIIPAAMRSKGFSVGAGGGSVTLEPTPPTVGAGSPSGVTPLGRAIAPAAATPTTLVLEGLKLLRRPPAPLGVFINLPPGSAPELNSPFYVGSLSLFNFDLGTGRLMAHGEDAAHADHAADARAPDIRFDVSQVLERQRARGLWEGGPITVTVTTIGASTGGDTTYVSFDSAVLTP